MPNLPAQHRGFQIDASFHRVARGFVASVMVSAPATGRQMLLTPPCPQTGFKTEDEAVAAGIDHAKAAIDGRVRGVDMRALRDGFEPA